MSEDPQALNVVAVLRAEGPLVVPFYAVQGPAICVVELGVVLFGQVTGKVSG